MIERTVKDDTTFVRDSGITYEIIGGGNSPIIIKEIRNDNDEKINYNISEL